MGGLVAKIRPLTMGDTLWIKKRFGCGIHQIMTRYKDHDDMVTNIADMIELIWRMVTNKADFGDDFLAFADSIPLSVSYLGKLYQVVAEIGKESMGAGPDPGSPLPVNPPEQQDQ